MTLEELARVAASEQESQARFQHRVHVCVAAGCLSSRSNQLKEALEAEVKQRGIGKACLVKGVGCMGPCAAGPLVAVASQGLLYQGVTPQDAAEIIHSLGTQPVKSLELPHRRPLLAPPSRRLCWRTLARSTQSTSKNISPLTVTQLSSSA